MKFFGGQRLRTHVHMKAPKRNKKGERSVTILFRITLNGNTVRSSPDVVKWAYEGVKTKGEDHIGIKKEVEGVNAEFFQLEESKRATLKLKTLHLQKLVVKEISSGKGDILDRAHLPGGLRVGPGDLGMARRLLLHRRVPGVRRGAGIAARP